MTTKSAAAMLPNALPITASPPTVSFNSLAVAKKLTVPPMYEAQRHPVRRAVVRCAYGMATKRNDTRHPIIEPILPAMKGSVIPRIVLLIAPDLDDVAIDLLLYDDPVDISDDDGADEDRRANTSDAGKKMLQHQSYRK